MKLWACAVTLLLVLVKENGASTDENRLLSHLLIGYNKLSRPVVRTADPVKLKLGVALREAISLNQDLGQIRTLLWLKMTWKDQLLRWDPVEYGGVTRVYVTQDKIWTPDIVLYNALHTEPDDEQNHLKLIINYNGEVTWTRPVTYTVTCKHEFRGNSWVCPFTFGSWVYHGLDLDIKSDTKRVDIDDSDFLTSDHFSLLDHEGKREIKMYKCCEEPYITMNYLVRFRHKLGPSLLGKK